MVHSSDGFACAEQSLEMPVRLRQRRKNMNACQRILQLYPSLIRGLDMKREPHCSCHGSHNSHLFAFPLLQVRSKPPFSVCLFKRWTVSICLNGGETWPRLDNRLYNWDHSVSNYGSKEDSTTIASAETQPKGLSRQSEQVWSGRWDIYLSWKGWAGSTALEGRLKPLVDLFGGMCHSCSILVNMLLFWSPYVYFPTLSRNIVYTSQREWWSLILHGLQHLGHLFCRSIDRSEVGLLQLPPNLTQYVPDIRQKNFYSSVTFLCSWFFCLGCSVLTSCSMYPFCCKALIHVLNTNIEVLK